MNCPICGKKTDKRYRPFCSKRCADVDLGKWLTGSYAIPTEEETDLDQAQDAASERGEKPH